MQNNLSQEKYLTLGCDWLRRPVTIKPKEPFKPITFRILTYIYSFEHFPSVSKIARDLEIKRDAVYKHLNILVKDKCLIFQNINQKKKINKKEFTFIKPKFKGLAHRNIPNWWIQQKHVDVYTYRLYLYLNSFGEERCYPSIRQMTQDCCMAIGTVQKTLKILQELESIEVINRGFGRAHNQYQCIGWPSIVDNFESVPLVIRKSVPLMIH